MIIRLRIRADEKHVPDIGNSSKIEPEEIHIRTIQISRCHNAIRQQVCYVITNIANLKNTDLQIMLDI